MPLSVTVNASNIGGTIIPGGSTPNLPVPATGRVTVGVNDAPALIAAGAQYVSTQVIRQTIPVAPRAATAARVVASTALANGTLSIANQPDVARQIGLRVDPGTTAITGGIATLTYTANDGTTTADQKSLATPASTIFTTNSSKGVQTLTSVIVTGLTGGASPVVQVDDTNSLSMIVPPNFAAFTVQAEFTDSVKVSGGTVASSAASITPTTTPNATHTYAFAAQFTAP